MLVLQVVIVQVAAAAEAAVTTIAAVTLIAAVSVVLLLVLVLLLVFKAVIVFVIAVAVAVVIVVVIMVVVVVVAAATAAAQAAASIAVAATAAAVAIMVLRVVVVVAKEVTTWLSAPLGLLNRASYLCLGGKLLVAACRVRLLGMILGGRPIRRQTGAKSPAKSPRQHPPVCQVNTRLAPGSLGAGIKAVSNVGFHLRDRNQPAPCR